MAVPAIADDVVAKPISDASTISFMVYEWTEKCSTIGPSARAGRKFSAPSNNAVPASNTPKTNPSEGIVPGLGGRRDIAANRPANDRASTARMYRPASIAIIVVVL